MRFCCTLLIVILYSLPGRAQWISQSSPFTNKVYEKVFFISPQRGFITGWNGVIIRTNDSGNTWQNRFSGTIFNLRDIIFRDTAEGFAAGEYQTIVRTTDGGNTWKEVHQKQGQYLNCLAFHDSLIIAAGDSGLMIRSTDSGHTWTPEPLPSTVNFEDAWISENGKIFLVGGSGIILSRGPADSLWSFHSSWTGLKLQDIFFAGNTAYIAGGEFGSGSTGVLLKSIDSGNTWQNLNIPSLPQMNGIYFTSPDTGFAVGAKGTILKTHNGGSSWFSQQSGTLNSLNGIYFKSKLSGFAAGDGSKILRTTNAGGIVGMSETAKDLLQINIYPNPANTIIYIDHAPGQSISKIELLEISGKVLHIECGTDLNILDLQKLNAAGGIYFLRITHSSGYVITKLRLQ